MKLMKEDVIQIIHSEKDLENPHCLIVLEDGKYNKTNLQSFKSLDVTNGKTYMTWLHLSDSDYMKQALANKIGPGIRIIAYITGIQENDTKNHLMLSAFDLEQWSPPHHD
jgi:hypothetical protein